MNNKTTFYIGILGAGLFVVSSVLGGVLIDDYSVKSQLISETYAIDTQYGEILRFLAIIPSGILFTLFAFAAYKKLPQSKLTKLGFIGLAIFYGIATVVVGIFPCDSGCNKQFINPSVSQFIHNLTGFLTYIFVPLCIILIAVALQKSPLYKRLSNVGIAFGIISYLFVVVLSANPNSEFIGLYQRIIEAVFILWIVSCAVKIKNIKTSS